MTFRKSCVALLLILARGLTALHWTSDSLAQNTVRTCSGHNASLLWRFTLDEGVEQLDTISWLRASAEASTPEMVATYSLDTFIPSPALRTHVHYAGNASIIMTGVKPTDSRIYSVHVLAMSGVGAISSISHNVSVQVEEPESAFCRGTSDLTDLSDRLHELESKHQTSVKEMQKIREENAGLRYKLNQTERDLRHELLETRTELIKTKHNLSEEITGLRAQLDEVRDRALSHVGFHAVLGRSVQMKIASERVRFEQAQFNDGGAYNATDGIFTAPVSGSYFFAFTTAPYSHNHTSNAFLMANGKPSSHVYNMYGANYYNMATAHAVLHLAEGHKAWVMSSGNGTQFFDPLSFFSGFLIHQF